MIYINSLQFVCPCGAEHTLIVTRSTTMTIEPTSESLQKTWPLCYVCDKPILTTDLEREVLRRWPV